MESVDSLVSHLTTERRCFPRVSPELEENTRSALYCNKIKDFNVTLDMHTTQECNLISSLNRLWGS